MSGPIKLPPGEDPPIWTAAVASANTPRRLSDSNCYQQHQNGRTVTHHSSLIRRRYWPGRPKRPVERQIFLPFWAPPRHLS